ncbi:unnamed protein product [Arctogadus glacialis]
MPIAVSIPTSGQTTAGVAGCDEALASVATSLCDFVVSGGVTTGLPVSTAADATRRGPPAADATRRGPPAADATRRGPPAADATRRGPPAARR